MYLSPRPGIVESYMLHVAKVNGRNLQHVIAKVSWYLELKEYKEYYGKPLQVWYSKLFEREGPATFMPVQRIKCKFVKIEQRLYNKDIFFFVFNIESESESECNCEISFLKTLVLKLWREFYDFPCEGKGLKKMAARREGFEGPL